MSHRHVGFRPERAADRVRVWAGFTRQTQPAVVVAVVVPNDGLLRFGKKVFPPRLDGEHAPAGWTKRQHGGRGGGGGGVFSSSTFTNTAVAVASPVPSSSTGVNDDGDDDDVVVLLS